MKKIESYEQLLDWAKRANTALTTKERCDLQDEFAHACISEMKTYFIEMVKNHPDDRRSVLFGISKLMGDLTMATYIGLWARTKANEVIEEDWQKLKEEQDRINAIHEDRWLELRKAQNNLVAREQIFKESKQPFFRKYRKMREKVEKLTMQLRNMKSGHAYMINQVQNANKHANQFEREARKYQQLMALLKEAS